jgi:hypothetical protein
LHPKLTKKTLRELPEFPCLLHVHEFRNLGREVGKDVKLTELILCWLSRHLVLQMFCKTLHGR